MHSSVSDNLEDLKKFLAGEKLYKEQKNKDAVPFTNKYPVILSSNHEPPKHDAFQPEKGRRLFIVRCEGAVSENSDTDMTTSSGQRKIIISKLNH